MSNNLEKKRNISKKKTCLYIEFWYFKEEILEELKNEKCNDFEDLVYRMQLTYDEIIDILDIKNKFPQKEQALP